MVATRVLKADADRFVERCSRRGVTPSAELRRMLLGMLATTANDTPDPERVFRDVAAALELPADTDPEALLMTLTDLAERWVAAQRPTPPPPAKLSRRDRDLCRKHGVDPAVFAARKASAVRRHGAPVRASKRTDPELVAALRRKGWTYEQYLAAKRQAVKRRA